jgi:hypothetical protein
MSRTTLTMTILSTYSTTGEINGNTRSARSTAVLTLQRHALDGQAYTIHFFLGLPPSPSNVAGQASILQFPHHVGLVYTFSGGYGRRDGTAPSCGNCEKQQVAGALARASVPLTIPLYCAAAAREIPHLGSSVVQPYLKDNLSWIAVSVGYSCSNGSILTKQWLTTLPFSCL